MIKVFILAATFVAHIPTVAEKRAISAALGNKLLDGETARYRWPKMLQKGTYCGWVNAKNSYGGYIGFQPFFAVADYEEGKFVVSSLLIDNSDGSDPIAGIAAKMCTTGGYDMASPPSS